MLDIEMRDSAEIEDDPLNDSPSVCIVEDDSSVLFSDDDDEESEVEQNIEENSDKIAFLETVHDLFGSDTE